MIPIKLRYYDALAAKSDGKPLTFVDIVILMRSNLVHEEIQFGENRWNVSFSSTLADKSTGCRFQYILYSHPKRWKTLIIYLTESEERMLWLYCCNLADLHVEWQNKKCGNLVGYRKPLHGQDNVKYDKLGLLSFALEKSGKWHLNVLRGIVWCWTGLVHPDKVKLWCSESCCKALNHLTLLQGRYPKTEIDPQESYEETLKWKGIQKG